MNLSFFIALRYLFAKKSHNVINIISAISSCGIAIGTAALMITLSIYNGFEKLIEESLNKTAPDLQICKAKGKYFTLNDSTARQLEALEEVKNIFPIVEEKVFASYEFHQQIVRLKGVDRNYAEHNPIKEKIKEGEFKLYKKGNAYPLALLGNNLAGKLNVNITLLSPIILYYPGNLFSDEANVIDNLKKGSSEELIKCISVRPGGCFSTNAEADNDLLIVHIDKVRELLRLKHNDFSAIEIYLKNICSESNYNNALIKKIKNIVGEEFDINNRFEQNKTLYRMLKYEKLFIYLILIFIVIIVGFNIFGSLSMLIIEKRDDIKILQYLGAQTQVIRKIFILEAWLISLCGLFAGLFVGIAFSLLQKHFGFIKMPANFILDSYPVIIKVIDIIITTICVAISGYLVSLFSVLSFSFSEKQK